MKNDVKRTHFRAWKSGKSWLYGASVLAILAGGAALSTTVSADTTATSSAAATTSTTASATPTVTTTSTGDNNPALATNDATTINVVPSSTITVGNTYDPATNFVSAKDGAGNPLTIGKGVTVDASKVNTAVAGTYQVTYSVTDTVTGKVETATANVTVVADQTSLAVKDTTLTQGQTYDPSSNFVSSTDSNGKVQTVGKGVTVDTGKLNMNVPGSYEVAFQTLDSLTGKMLTNYANVTVVATQASLSVQDSTMTIGSTFDPAKSFLSATNADDTPVGLAGNTSGLPVGVTVDTSKLNTAVAGTYPVTYSVADSATGKILTNVANVTVYARTLGIFFYGISDINTFTITKGQKIDPASLNIDGVDSEGNSVGLAGNSYGYPAEITLNTGDVDTNTVGNYTASVTLTDPKSGQSLTEYITINVVADQASLSSYMASINVGDAFTPSNYVSGADSYGNVVSVGSGITVVSNNVDTSKAGVYQVVYSMPDKVAGTTLTTTETVMVKNSASTDQTSLSPQGYNFSVTQGQSFDPSNYVNGTDSSGNSISVGNGITVISNNVDTSKLGIYQVVYGTKNAAGQEITMTQNIAVVADQTIFYINSYTMSIKATYDPLADSDPRGFDSNGNSIDSSKITVNDTEFLAAQKAGKVGTYPVYFSVADPALSSGVYTAVSNVTLVTDMSSLYVGGYAYAADQRNFYLNVGNSFDSTQYFQSATDSLGNSINLTNGVTETNNLPLDKNGNVTTPGTYQVYYSIADKYEPSGYLTEAVNITVTDGGGNYDNTVVAAQTDKPSLSVQDTTIPVGSTYNPNVIFNGELSETFSGTDSNGNYVGLDYGITVDDSKVNTAVAGYYPITYSVKKADGSTLSKVANVIVTNSTSFVQTEITTQNEPYDLSTAITPHFYESIDAASLTDLGMVVTLTDPNGKSVDVDWKSGTFTPTIVGTYTESYTYTNQGISMPTQQGTIYIKVIPKAALSSVSDLTETLSGSATTYTFTPSVTASDSSAVTVAVVDSTGKVISATSGSYALPVGTYTVTYTDANASNSPLTQTITVKPAPTLSSVSNLAETLSGSATAYTFTPSVTASDDSAVTVSVVDSTGKGVPATSGSYALPSGLTR